jgi:hypothetical protein
VGKKPEQVAPQVDEAAELPVPVAPTMLKKKSPPKAAEADNPARSLRASSAKNSIHSIILIKTL